MARDEQIKVVEAMIARGVAGIVIAPLDENALVPVLKQADKQGIPVVIFDSGLKWDGRKSMVATDNTKGGQIAARQLGSLMKGTGKVAMMRYMEGSASTRQREDGFLSALKEEFPGIQVVSSDQHGGATVGEAPAGTHENLLTKFKDVQGVYAPNESTTYAFMKALRDGGRKKKIAFVGFDASEKLITGLEQQDIDALVVQNPARMGQLAVATMDVLDGKQVPAFVDTGVMLVTRDNVQSPEVQAVVKPKFPPAAAAPK